MDRTEAVLATLPHEAFCLAHPGSYLDTPQAYTTSRRFEPIEVALPINVVETIWLALDRDGEHLYVGMTFKQLRTSRVSLFGVSAGITIWHEVTPRGCVLLAIGIALNR